MRKLTQEAALNLCIQAHGDRYDYSKLKYVNRRTKFTIICKEHGEYAQLPQAHWIGQNCPDCAEKQRLKTLAVSNGKTQIEAEAGITKALRAGVTFLPFAYERRSQIISFVCRKHGEFKQRIDVAIRSGGCQKCGKEIADKSHLLDKRDFIKKAKNRFGDTLDYSGIDYKGCFSEVTISCKKHGKFSVIPWRFLQSMMGCKRCARIVSQADIEITEFLSQYAEVITHNRKIIAPFELDIYLPEHNIAVEHNGIIWHSEKFNSDNSKHQKKHLLCKEKGIHLIQIWEDEWRFNKELVKKMLLAKLKIFDQRIYARKTVKKAITGKDARLFFAENHISGFRPASKHIGLFLDNNLVCAISIARPGTFMANQEADMEIVRFATLAGCRVIGGLSKLLSGFKSKTISTFADALWYDGYGYQSIGFKKTHLTNPGYFYIKPGSLDRHHRYSFAKHKLKDKLPDFNPDKSEKENMTKHGYYKLWDAGHYKLIKEAGVYSASFNQVNDLCRSR